MAASTAVLTAKMAAGKPTMQTNATLICTADVVGPSPIVGWAHRTAGRDEVDGTTCSRRAEQGADERTTSQQARRSTEAFITE